MDSAASQDPELLERELAELTTAGPQAWRAWLGQGSNLFVELGERRQESYQAAGKQRVHEVGSWSLWVEMAAWSIEDADRVIVACEDPRPVIAERIPVLQGRRLTAVMVGRPALDAVFDFDGVRLLVFPAHSAASADHNMQWRLSRPQGDSISVVSGSTWVVEPDKR